MSLSTKAAGAQPPTVASVTGLAAALAAKAESLLGIQAQTGTSHTLEAADAGRIVTLENAEAITVTVPPNAEVAFAIGTQILLRQKGAGQVTVAPGAGVTLQSHESRLKLTGQHAGATLIKEATDTWAVMGNMTA